MGSYFSGYRNFVFPGLMAGWLSLLVVPLLFWSIFWTGWALWRAAKDDNKVWFVILLLVHTMGILDIIYIFAISKKQEKPAKKKK